MGDNNYNKHAGLIKLVLRSQLHKHKEAEKKRNLVQTNMITPHGISTDVIETLNLIPSQYPRPRPRPQLPPSPPTDSLDALMNSVAKGNNKSRRRGTRRRGTRRRKGKGRRGTRRRGKGRN